MTKYFSEMFNVRVYGILIQENKLLLVEEFIRDQLILKFPGGGLEIGEGTLDCLKREFKEELNIEINNIRHFYTTDFYVQSFLHPEQQVISIYYLCSSDMIEVDYILHQTMHFKWIDIEILSEDLFFLPIDKIVVRKIKDEVQR